MIASRHDKAPAARQPIWRHDARECLVALLPELAIAIVSFTCLSVIVGYSSAADMSALITIAAVAQIIVQAIMYTTTYLTDNLKLASAGWMLAVLAAYGVGMVVFASNSGFSGGALRLVPMSSALAGVFLFGLTRARGTFVSLVLLVLSASSVISEMPGVLPVHLVGVCALAALFVMRCSAARVTMEGSYDKPAPSSRNAAEETSTHQQAHPSSLYVQVAGFGVAVAAFCLVLSLVGASLPWRTLGADAPPQTSQQVPSASAEHAESADASASQEDASGQEQSMSSIGGEAGQTDVLPARRSGAASRTLMVVPLLVALLATPFVAKSLRRWYVRRSIEREPEAADCVARLYVGIVSRLDALGIKREEASTPREFLTDHADDLQFIATTASLDTDAWETLTNAYEQARYANLGPSASELQTCWQLYDALPAYGRKTLGWGRYLAGPYWYL